MSSLVFQVSPGDLPSLAESIGLLERIIAAFRRCQEQVPSSNAETSGSVWDGSGWCGRQAAVLDALRSGSAPRVHATLNRFFLSSDAYGFALGADDHQAIVASVESRARFVQDWTVRLRTAASALGVVDVLNPEREAPASALVKPDSHEAIPALISRMEAATGVCLGFPPIMGAYGCGWPGHLAPIPYQAISYYLVAANCIGLVGAAGSRILEFGGGFGGVALYLHRYGVGSYASYDLPFACAIQAFFLGTSLGPEEIRLFSEDEGSQAHIELQPAGLLEAKRPAPYDLLLAQDSLVELPAHVARRTLANLLATNRGYFLSIAPDFTGSTNLWDGTRVRALVPEIGTHRLALRYAYPLRDGHLSELFVRRAYQ